MAQRWNYLYGTGDHALIGQGKDEMGLALHDVLVEQRGISPEVVSLADKLSQEVPDAKFTFERDAKGVLRITLRYPPR